MATLTLRHNPETDGISIGGLGRGCYQSVSSASVGGRDTATRRMHEPVSDTGGGYSIVDAGLPEPCHPAETGAD